MGLESIMTQRENDKRPKRAASANNTRLQEEAVRAVLRPDSQIFTKNGPEVNPLFGKLLASRDQVAPKNLY